MRIFVTGASGWIGSAVVPELLSAGHDVVGLSRSAASAQRLEAAGAIVHHGDVDDPDGLAKAAADSDGVIHLAFQHEVAWSGNFAAAAAADRRAVEAMGAALADSDRPLVLASGLLGLTVGRVATEDDGLVPSAEIRGNPAGRRSATALFTLSLEASASARRYCVCPPRSTATATTGSWPPSSASPASGAWPDTWATAPTAGPPCTAPTPPAWPAWPSRQPRPVGLHAVATRASPSARSPRSIGRQLGIPTSSVAPADAREHFAHLGHFVAVDSPATAAVTRGSARVEADRAQPARGPRAGPLLPPGVIPRE